MTTTTPTVEEILRPLADRRAFTHVERVDDYNMKRYWDLDPRFDALRERCETGFHRGNEGVICGLYGGVQPDCPSCNGSGVLPLASLGAIFKSAANCGHDILVAVMKAVLAADIDDHAEAAARALVAAVAAQEA